jgi:hypothetical protein
VGEEWVGLIEDLIVLLLRTVAEIEANPEVVRRGRELRSGGESEELEDGG